MKVKKEPTFTNVVCECIAIGKKTPVELGTVSISLHGKTEQYNFELLSVTIYDNTNNMPQRFIGAFYPWGRNGYNAKAMRELREAIGELKKKRGKLLWQ